MESFTISSFQAEINDSESNTSGFCVILRIFNLLLYSINTFQHNPDYSSMRSNILSLSSSDTNVENIIGGNLQKIQN